MSIEPKNMNDQIFLLSLNELKDLVFLELNILGVATTYVLAYVVYKVLGRYVYFKPEEHASKVNRTFLGISLLVIGLHTLSAAATDLPILVEHRWLYILSCIIILVAPLSILMDWVLWKYDVDGSKTGRNWRYDYLPIPYDYYKTHVSKSVRDGGSIQSWEDEGVESTSKNLHSDALLNLLALAVFLVVSGIWTYESSAVYGWYAYAFSGVLTITIAILFIDRGIFSWMTYVKPKYFSLVRALRQRRSR